ncbi:MAG: ABC transporter permease subunit [Anaerolineales bacterium]|nr:ABC transporter permease subunit [Anaerolineales bacterium]
MNANATPVKAPLSERLLSPILIKEMRSSMRGARFFVGITFFLLLIATVSLMVYYVQALDSYSNPTTIGRTLFGFMTAVESMLLMAIAPSLTAGAIAGERQKQTFEMLMATPLGVGQVLRGKLAASLNYLFLLLIAAIPINSIVFLLGGITPGSLIAWIIWLSVSVIMLATFGLLVSSWMTRAGLATTLTYLLSALLFVVLPVMMLFIGTSFFFAAGNQPPCRSLASLGLLHPLAGFMAINGVFSSNWTSYWPYLIAVLSFYIALSGLFYLASRARLSSILGVPNRRRWLIVVPLVVAIVAVVAIVTGPVEQLCNFPAP